MGEWYYIGHYGQLGPLTRVQIDDLISAQVIGPDTYVWVFGMPEWLQAGKVPDLAAKFSHIVPAPPSPPSPPGSLGSPAPSVMPSPSPAPMYASYPHSLATLQSDKNRVTAGVLQILLPGVGRMYLGYWAIGLLQLLCAVLCSGIGWIVSIVNGIMILSGKTNYDGYGRRIAP